MLARSPERAEGAEWVEGDLATGQGIGEASWASTPARCGCCWQRTSRWRSGARQWGARPGRTASTPHLHVGLPPMQVGIGARHPSPAARPSISSAHGADQPPCPNRNSITTSPRTLGSSQSRLTTDSPHGLGNSSLGRSRSQLEVPADGQHQPAAADPAARSMRCELPDSRRVPRAWGAPDATHQSVCLSGSGVSAPSVSLCGGEQAAKNRRWSTGAAGARREDGPAQSGELRIGCLRSKNSGSPMLSLFISSIWACNSGGSSLRSPSRASASEVKYMTIV